MPAPQENPHVNEASLESATHSSSPFHTALEPILHRLVLIQRGQQKAEQRLEALAKLEDALNEQQAAPVASAPDEVQADTLQTRDAQLKQMIHILKQVQQDLHAQQNLFNAYFGWKYLAGQFLAISLVTAVTVAIGLRLFPPNPYPLLDQKLQILYDRIEGLQTPKP